MIVPETLSGVSHYLIISKAYAVVIQESKLVWWEYVGSRLRIEFGPDFGEAFFEKLGKALVDTTFAVLSDVDSLAKGEVAMASYIFCVATHVDVVGCDSVGVKVDWIALG